MRPEHRGHLQQGQLGGVLTPAQVFSCQTEVGPVTSSSQDVAAVRTHPLLPSARAETPAHP